MSVKICQKIGTLQQKFGGFENSRAPPCPVVVSISKTECFPESQTKGQRSENVNFKNETGFMYTYILNLSQEFALVWDFLEFSVLCPKLARKYALLYQN